MMKKKKYQKYNKRNNSWVMMEDTPKGTRILNVKERMPSKPFKGVKVKR